MRDDFKNSQYLHSNTDPQSLTSQHHREYVVSSERLSARYLSMRITKLRATIVMTRDLSS